MDSHQRTGADVVALLLNQRIKFGEGALRPAGFDKYAPTYRSVYDVMLDEDGRTIGKTVLFNVGCRVMWESGTGTWRVTDVLPQQGDN